MMMDSSKCFALEIDTATVMDDKLTMQLQTLTICNVTSFRPKCLMCGQIFSADLSILLHLQAHNNNQANQSVEPPPPEPQQSEATPLPVTSVQDIQDVDEYTMTGEPPIASQATGVTEQYVVFEVQQEATENVPVAMNEALESAYEGLPSDEDENTPAVKPVRSKRSSHAGSGQTTPIKKHACDQCSWVFTTKTKLNVHLRTHTGERPFPCPVCEKRFTTRGELTVHVRIHTGVRPYQCPKCDSLHRTRSSLHCHLARHHQEKAYMCEICDRKFAVKHYYTAHMRIHDDANPLKCSKCGVSFAYMSYMRKHEKRNNCSQNAEGTGNLDSNEPAVKKRKPRKMRSLKNGSMVSNQTAVKAETELKTMENTQHDQVCIEQKNGSTVSNQTALKAETEPKLVEDIQHVQVGTEQDPIEHVEPETMGNTPKATQ